MDRGVRTCDCRTTVRFAFGPIVGLLLLSVTATGHAAQRPDLTIGRLANPPPVLAPGASLPVTLTLANRGSARARGSTVLVLLSRDTRRDAKDVRLGTLPATALKARRSVTATKRLTLPRTVTAGRWYLLACADGAAKVRERSEQNNCTTAKRALSVAGAGTPGTTGAGGGPLVPSAPGAPGATTPEPGPGPGPGPAPVIPPPPPDGPPPIVPLGTPTPMPAGAVPLLKDASAFIYSGASPSQRGVAPGTISARRVAVLHGRVLDELGAPLPGVRVDVLDHPEFGFTVSRSDGRYDMVINGGGVTLVLELAGHLPVQVAVSAPWRDYEVVPDAVLTKLSPKVTTVDIASPTPLQVVEGGTPPGGGEPSTLLVPQGTAPTMRLPDGSTKPVTDLAVRITEFPADEKALPGPMPGTAAPTYAAEFSVDQALTAGATRVDFATPLVNYTPNFIGAPVGSRVPSAWYDKEQATWVPSKDGRVIKITGEAGGKAQLDIGATTPAALGIDDAELVRLAELYDVGDELWRVLIDHFTPWDHNFPYGPPPGAKAPPLKDFVWKDPNDPCQRKGSTIACESQTLGEDVPVTGTPLTLHYGSNRVPGYTAGRKLEVPVTTGALPDKLHGIQLTLDVAGRHLEKRWCDPSSGYTGTGTCMGLDPITPNLTYGFEWDGKDAYGREVQGRPLATVTVTYVYEFFYYEASSDLEASFGQMPSSATASNGAPYCGNQQPFPFGGIAPLDPGALAEWAEQVRQQHFFCGILIRETTQRGLGAWDATAVDGLGGLTLSNHHAYDPQEHVVHRGDGSTLRAEPLGAVLRDVAGTRRAIRPTATPVDADDADLDSLVDIAQGPDGALYGASSGNQEAVWRMGGDGQLRRIAGRDCDPFTPTPGPECPEEGPPGPDGSPAQGAILGGALCALEVGPDGSVYLLVTGANTPANPGYGSINGYVRRISPSGILTTIAGRDWRSGSGITVPIGDGGPALGAAIDGPRDLELGPDGSLYVSERGTYTGGKARVRKIAPNGIITTIAGGGTDNAADDQDLGAGEPATAQNLGIIYGIAVDEDGTVYLADPSGHRVQRIARDGILTRLVGDGAGAIEYGERGTNAKVGDPVKVALGTRGEVYVRTNTSGGGSDLRILRLSPDATVLPVAGRQQGTGSNSLNDDGEAANAAMIGGGGPGLEVQPDGQLLFTDGREEVRRVEPPLPEAGPDSLLIPTPDGDEVWAFDALGRHQRTVDALTGATRWTFDYTGPLLSAARDADGNTVRIERTAGGAATAIVAPGGQRTTLARDAAGRTTSIANPLGETTALEYGATGLLTRFTQPGARVSTYAYDAEGRLTRAVSPSGGEQQFTRAETPDRTQVTARSGEGRVTTYVAESLGDGTRQRVVTKPSGATTTLRVLPGGEREVTAADGTTTVQQFGRDPRWGAAVPLVSEQVTTTPGGKTMRLTQGTSATLSDPANPLSVTELTTNITRDAPTGPDENTSSTYRKDTDTVTIRSDENRTSETKLDARGRVQATDPDGFGDLDEVALTYDGRGLVSRVDHGTQHQTFAYDAAGRLTSRTDATGQAVTFTYDAADRVRTRTLPGGHVYRYAYAADGTLASITMPGGQVYGVTIDAEGRIASLRPPLPAGAAYVRSYDFDGAMRLLTMPTGAVRDPSYAADGRETGAEYGAERDVLTYPAAQERPSALARTRDADGGSTQRVDLGYDGFLPTSITQVGPAAGAFAYTASPQLRLAQTVLTAGADTVTTPMTQDGDGRAITVGPLTFTRDFSSGQVTDVTDGTLTAEYAYDGVGRLAERKLTIGGAVRYRLQVGRDTQTGRVRQRTETVNTTARVLDHAYDGRGELTSVKEGAADREVYVYDGNGNRTSSRLGTAATETAAYDASDRLTSRGGIPYAFNADGFLTSRGADTLTYGASGDLLSATVGGVTVTYGYDALGRRAWRKQGAAVTTYLYGDPADPLRLSASRGADGVLSTYGYDDEGALLTIRRGATTFYVGADQVGSPAVVLSAAGAVVGRFPRDAYGRPGSGGTALPFELPIGFAGGIEDAVTGLVRFGLRDYEPASGRFTARDPSMFGGSPANLFAYVGSDPVGHRDPTGLACIGASLYAGVGGGLQWCRKDGKMSFCAEGGVGAGGGIDVDPFGGTATTGTAMQAELTGKFGPGSVTVGGELDLDCMNSKGYLKGGVALTGISAGVDTDGNFSPPTFGGSDKEDFNGRGVRNSDGSLGAKAEGKVVLRGCGEY